MKVRAVVQRSGKGEGRFPFAEYLAGAPLARVWTRDRAEAVEFPDYMPSGPCPAAAHCNEHAECAAKAHGGWPVVVSGAETKPEPIQQAPAPTELAAPAAPVSPITQRIRDSRAKRRKTAENRAPIPPAEVFARMERRNEA